MITFIGRPCFVCDVCGAIIEGEGVYVHQLDVMESAVFIAHLGHCAESLTAVFDGRMHMDRLTSLVTLLNPKEARGRVVLKGLGFDVDGLNSLQVIGRLGQLGYVWRDGWVKLGLMPCIDVGAFHDGERIR